jgi:hypothetical protein
MRQNNPLSFKNVVLDNKKVSVYSPESPLSNGGQGNREFKSSFEGAKGKRPAEGLRDKEKRCSRSFANRSARPV